MSRAGTTHLVPPKENRPRKALQAGRNMNRPQSAPEPSATAPQAAPVSQQALQLLLPFPDSDNEHPAVDPASSPAPEPTSADTCPHIHDFRTLGSFSTMETTPAQLKEAIPDSLYATHHED